MRSIEEIHNELQEIVIQINELEDKRSELWSDLRKAEEVYADDVVNSMIHRCFVDETKHLNYIEKRYHIYYKKTKAGYYYKRTFTLRDDNDYIHILDNKYSDASYVVKDVERCEKISMEEFKNIISTGIEEYISKLRRRLTEQFNEVTL